MNSEVTQETKNIMDLIERDTVGCSLLHMGSFEESVTKDGLFDKVKGCMQEKSNKEVYLAEFEAYLEILTRKGIVYTYYDVDKKDFYYSLSPRGKNVLNYLRGPEAPHKH